jgi:hypothetical protein
VSLNESLIEEINNNNDEENGQKEPNNDRELIDDFMLKVREAQKQIIEMQDNNREMKNITDATVNENSTEKQQGN